MSKTDSQLTVVAFSQNREGKPADWQAQDFGERVYMITEDGIWRSDEGPFVGPPAGAHHNWWTFTGMTAFVRNPGSGL